MTLPHDFHTAGETETIESALECGDWLAAERLLAAGALPPPYAGDPNAETGAENYRNTALTDAIKHSRDYRRHFELLSNGADVNKPDGAGDSPLALALKTYQSFLAVQLVKRGAWLNPEKPDPDEIIDLSAGATRLLSVILERDDVQAVKRILDSGPDVDKADFHGLTPLALARALKWPEAEDLLLAHGANPDVAFPDPNQTIRSSSAPLLSHACSSLHCHVSYVQALLDAGADPNAAEDDGTTAIHWAAMYDRLDAFLVLEAAGADITKKDLLYHKNALHRACENLSCKVALHILDNCPPDLLNLPTAMRGETLLHLASRHPKSAPLIRQLVRRGALVNVQNDDTETPLVLAVQYGDLESVRTLIELGADVEKAFERCNEGSPVFSLVNSISAKNLPVARLLLANGANPDARTTMTFNGHTAGDSLIYAAVRHHNYALAQELFKAGADPHGTSGKGQSAMDFCLRLRFSEGVRLLLENGFDPLRHFDFTQVWDSNNGATRVEHHSGSAYDCAKSLAEKVGRGTKYGEMLQLIEEHLAAVKHKPLQAAKSRPAQGPSV